MQHVGERLLASRPQNEADVRARLSDQAPYRVGDRTMVPLAVEVLEESQCFGNGNEVPRRLGGQGQLLAGIPTQLLRNAERMEGAETVAELE